MPKTKSINKDKEVKQKTDSKVKKAKQVETEVVKNTALSEKPADSPEEKQVKLKKAGPKKARAKQELSAEKQDISSVSSETVAQSPIDETASLDNQTAAAAKVKVVSPKKERSKKYQAVRAKVDRTRTYDITSAVELVKKLSMTKFVGTISAHLVVTEEGISREVTLPHSTGRSRIVEIASEATLAKIEAGQLDFDVLISTPQFMSKLTKFAAVLGPKGLMPNPKSGTLTTNPEQRQKELQAGSIMIKTERKAPLIHASIGKTDMETNQLAENLTALITSFKGKIKSITLAATMSPGVKVEWEK